MTSEAFTVRETSHGASFAVRAQPRARQNQITGVVGDALKIALTAPPVEGKANSACIALLAAILRCPRGAITIAAGASSRNKIVHVIGMSAADVRARLEEALSREA